MTQPEPCPKCKEEGLGLDIPGWYDGLCIIHHRREKLAQQRAASYWDKFRPGRRPAAGGYWSKFRRVQQQ